MRPYRSQFRALTEGLYALRKGTYVPNLNFRYGSFSFWGVGHVPVGILPIFMSLLPFHLSYVAVSRPCCLSEFYPSRAFRMGIGIYSGGERGEQGTVLTSLQHLSNEQVAHQHKHLMCHDCGCRRSCQQVSNTKKINGCHFISLINYWALACVTLQENIGLFQKKSTPPRQKVCWKISWEGGGVNGSGNPDGRGALNLKIHPRG